ncbi:DEAD/DEAH box helicase [Candidatus Pacearchaeota archaeon]|jgi:superfamily II DNA or RNA helicase|nr:DEAD/DEAH box helicase [Candidatus Pacearchaeota archaeon]
MDITLRGGTKRSNVYFSDAGLSPEELKIIVDATSYDVPGAEYSPKYGTSWDGRYHMMRRAHNGMLYVPIGLLALVEAILTKLGHNVTVELPPKPPQEYTWAWNGPDLRPYQVQDILEAMKWVESGRGCIMKSPTGGGKSLSSLKIIQMLGAQTIVVVPNTTLAKQWIGGVRSALGVEPFYYHDTKRDMGSITIATAQTLAARLKNKEVSLDQFKFLCVDEVHRFAAKTFWTVSMSCPAFYRLGLSATPENRKDGADLKFVGGLGHVISTTTATDLVDQGFLARPKFIFLTAPKPTVLGNTYAAAYKWGVVKNDGRNKKIAAMVSKATSKGGSVYVHVTQVVHGQILNRMIPGSALLTGVDGEKKREDVITDFKAKKILCLISTLLGEGADIPNMDAFINAAGGTSEIATIQRIGRVLRPAPGKKYGYVIDFSDSGKYVSRHSMERKNIYVKVFGETLVFGDRPTVTRRR